MLDLLKLDDAVRHEGGVSRRFFLAYAASLSAIPLVGRTAFAKQAKAKLHEDPFRLGVASGDPTSSGVVLWTRLTPKPLDADSGMEPANVTVSWEIAADEAMRK